MRPLACATFYSCRPCNAYDGVRLLQWIASRGRVTEHEFRVLPSVGHLINFTGHLNGDYVASRVGFFQEADGFVACVWTEAPSDGERTHGSASGLYAENDSQFG
jgi:hypothetical protein